MKTGTKLLVAVAIFALSLLPISQAFADGEGGHKGFYISGTFGGLFVEDFDAEGVSLETDTGFAASGALGYDFGPFRVEGEYSYRDADFDQISASGMSVDLNGGVTTHSVMANVYYDFHNQSPFTPYLGAGVGYGWHEAETSNIGGLTCAGCNGDDDDFAYQFMAGVSYTLSERMNLFTGYRYYGSEGFGYDYNSHGIDAGIRFNF